MDRCSPEKALEVLESLKAFFDIEGFVYVIGMNSESIDSIVKKKYGEDFDNGLEYMQKIVQLPFEIPTWKEGWKEEEVAQSIVKIISKDLEGSDLLTKFEDDQLKKLIVKAVQLNPRQVKRFINNVILAQAVFDKDIDKLIVVQALSFRSDWHRFLALITPSTIRDEFFSGYETLKNDLKNITSEKDLSELRDSKKSDPSLLKNFRVCFEIYKELINPDGGKDLLSFLDAGADKILKEITEMENYRIALASVKVKGPEPTLVAVTPNDSDLNVPINSFITARFSEPMLSSTITSNTFILKGSLNNRPVTGTVALSQDGLTATFTPFVNLNYSDRYLAIITTGVTSEEGIPMTSNKMWSFITTAQSDATPSDKP